MGDGPTLSLSALADRDTRFSAGMMTSASPRPVLRADPKRLEERGGGIMCPGTGPARDAGRGDNEEDSPATGASKLYVEALELPPPAPPRCGLNMLVSGPGHAAIMAEGDFRPDCSNESTSTLGLRPKALGGLGLLMVGGSWGGRKTQ